MDFINIKRRQASAIVLLFIFLSAIFTASAVTEKVGGVRGQVVRPPDETPVGGIKFTLSGKKAISDEEGRFNFNDIPAGDYLLRSTSPRFLNQVIAVRIKTGEDLSLVVKIILRVTKLEGRIVDEEGNPVIGVEIYTNPEIDETKTDEKGHFLFNKKRLLDEMRRPSGEEAIPSGEYIVYAQKLQYTKAEKTITIIPGLRNNLGTLIINKIGLPTADDSKRRLESPSTIDEPTQGAGEVKLD